MESSLRIQMTEASWRVISTTPANCTCDEQVVITRLEMPLIKVLRVPLVPKVDKMNSDTHLLIKKATEIIRKLQKHWDIKENISSVYKLHNTDEVIRW